MKKLITIIFCAFLLVACNNASPDGDSTATAVQVAEVTNTPTPEPTTTNTPEPTATNTETPTETPTNTPTLTPTETPTSTPTPTETPTDTPTPAPTIPPVTNTPIPPPTPDIPLYPNTPIQPWNQSVFVNSVNSMQNTIHDIQDYLGGSVNGCAFILGYYGSLENLPAFTDVPLEWQAHYREYRFILHDTRIALIPITDQCRNPGDVTFLLNQSQEQTLFDSLATLRGRAEQLVVNVQGGG